ncbi:unnamed protein product [Acidithrix sp. C25]|nr:unnamed protein product [Acidithrix sp. C25]
MSSAISYGNPSADSRGRSVNEIASIVICGLTAKVFLIDGLNAVII